jgi:hypothetical protein
MAVSTGTKARTGSWLQEDRVMRRASSGMGGRFSAGIMIPAEK